MSRHKPHLDPATGAPRHPLPDTSADSAKLIELAAPVETRREMEDRLIQKAVFASGELVQDHLPQSSAETSEATPARKLSDGHLPDPPQRGQDTEDGK